MAIYIDDGGQVRPKDSLSAAIIEMRELVEKAQAECDPEWPTWIEDLAIYEAPLDCEDPIEDGKLLYVAKEANHRPADEGSRCDYFCDYVVGVPTR